MKSPRGERKWEFSMTWNWSKRLLLLLSLLLYSGCLPLTQYRIPEEEIPEKTEIIKEEKPVTAPVVSTQQKKDDKQVPEEKSTPSVEQIPPPSEDEDNTISPEASQVTNQELLDSAMDFYQASNDFWEHGDLDNALDALDKAYSLILKVNQEDNPEVSQQKEDLRITISKRIIEVYTSRFTVANGQYKAIPLVMNRHVERALNSFKGREGRFFLDAYRRSGKYRPAIVKALRDSGLPEELSWLPLIESGFKVRALSRARALGMWQFIASTGYKYGLKRDRWIDERMDPEKSTKAAVAYLKELHQIFGDWTTALAAYNCGEFSVLKRIKTQKINYLDNFWDLYEKLPRETAFYVPKFLAVLHILNDPQTHGLILPPVDKEIQIEEVTINKQVHLETITKRLGIDYKVLKDLNPELRHHLTPKHPYSLKVPKGKGETLLAELSDIPVYKPPVPLHVVHRVQRGETLSVIAQRYRTSIRAIMNMNGLRRQNFLKVGWMLKIPTNKSYSAPTQQPPVVSSKRRGKLFEYTVNKGDSLWKIADRFHTTANAIRSLNQLGNSALQIGQVLMIPSSQSSSKPGKIKKYRVRPGDSPYLISKKYQMNLAEFLKINNLTPRSTIFPGQMVFINTE